MKKYFGGKKHVILMQTTACGSFECILTPQGFKLDELDV
jgi:hypothetical protein